MKMKTKICVVVSTLLALSTSVFAPGQVALAYVAKIPLPHTELDEKSRLTLARALVGEADWSVPDHVAICWVLAKRWALIESKYPGSVSFDAFVKKYAAPLKTKTARTAWVQSLPWGPLPETGKLAAFTKHWDRVRELVDKWADGEIPDPCPKAHHYGGTMDRAWKGLRPVNCGLTQNIFYTVHTTR